MANVRIKDLSTTASTTASDDFFGVDGATNGTRKLNAYSPTFGGNLTVSGTTGVTATDLTLGTSGPSVKSTLSARAPRQGLVFDGTNGATVANVPAFGTGAFTVAAWVNPVATASTQYIFSGGSTAFGFRLLNGGTIQTTKMGTADNTASSGTLAAGKTALVVYTRSGTTGTYYINGVAAGTTTDSQDYPVAVTVIGKHGFASQDYWTGSILTPITENRALSAAEVVALYESGAPSGADYNNASNTAINTSAFTNNGTFGLNYGTFSGASATGFTAAQATATAGMAEMKPNLSAKVGKRYRVSFTATLTSGQAPKFQTQDGSGNQCFSEVTVTNGANSFEVTMNSFASGTLVTSFYTSNVTSYAISGFSMVPLGLLLAPDAAQAGGGLVWYDTSGNAANITLPASGVSWNVPTSFSTAGGWTYGSTTPPTLQIANTTSGLANTQTAANNVVLGTLKFGHPSDGQSDKFPSIVGRFDPTDASFARATQLEFYTSSSAGNALGMTLNKDGNLTVSGTGNSSVAGNFGVGTTSPVSNANQRSVTINGTNYSRIDMQKGGVTYGTLITDDASTSLSTIGNLPLQLNTNGSVRATITGGGNFLVGTTIDGGQKLQVSGNAIVSAKTSTATASSLVVGDDLAITTNSGRSKMTLGSTNSISEILLGQTSSNCLVLQWEYAATVANAKALIGTYGYSNPIAVRASSITLETGGSATTALTLDSSQNATFAGTVTASTAGNYVLQLKDTRSQAADVGASIGLQGTYTGSLQTTFGSILGLKVNSTDGNFAGKLVFQTRPNGGSLTTALTLDDSQNATFAGSKITLGGSGNGDVDIRRAANSNGSSVSYRTSSTLKWYHGMRGLVNDNWYLQNEVAANTALVFDAATSDATFGGKITTSAPTGGAGAWELGVANAVSPTAPNRTITIEIGGTVYYLHAKTTND